MLNRVLLVGVALALFVCQIKGDKTQGLWFRQNLGKVTHAVLDPIGLVIVATDTPVIAALNARTGEVKWRQILHDDERIDKLILIRSNDSKSKKVVSLSNGSVTRIWRVNDGRLQWESSNVWPAKEGEVGDLYFDNETKGLLVLTPYGCALRTTKETVWSFTHNKNDEVPALTNTDEIPKHTFVKATKDDSYVYLVGTDADRKVAVMVLDLMTGEAESEVKVSTVETNSMALQGTTLWFATDNGATSELMSLDLSKNSDPQSATKMTVPKGFSGPFTVEGDDSGVVVRSADGGALAAGSDGEWVYENPEGAIGVSSSALVQARVDGSKLQLSWDAGKATTVSFDTEQHGDVAGVFPLANTKNRQALILAEDFSIHCFKEGKSQPVWMREEGLAKPAHVEIFTKPEKVIVESSIPSQFKGSYVKRVTDDIQYGIQLVTELVTTCLGLLGERESFGFRKIVLVWSTSGKLYALESDNGNVIWSKFPKADARLEPVGLYVFDSGSVIMIGKTATQTAVYQLDPESGSTELLGELATAEILSVSQFKEHVIIVNKQLNYKIYPESNDIAEQILENFYFTVPAENSISGYKLVPSEQAAQLNWVQSYEAGHERIVHVAKRQHGLIISNTIKILPDKTNMYKYINPHLLVVCTLSAKLPGRAISQDAEPNQHLNVYLIDAITGQVYERFVHKDAAGPISAIQVENTVTYHFWNSFTLESEVHSVHLWEEVEEYGVDNSVEHSSFRNIGRVPLVNSQAFNIEVQVKSLQVSKTKFGVTHRAIIASTTAGNVLRIDERMLDPRRPTEGTTPNAEGLMPYRRYLPIPTTYMLNHGTRCAGLQGVKSASAAIESTSLILGFGVDMFFRRITPSKTFDMLSPDFDYIMLAGVVGGVLAGIFFSKSYLAKKSIDDAWQ